MPEDLRGHSRLGDEGDDAHRLAASRTQEGINLEDAAQQLGPPAAEGAPLGVGRRRGRGLPICVYRAAHSYWDHMRRIFTTFSSDRTW